MKTSARVRALYRRSTGREPCELRGESGHRRRQLSFIGEGREIQMGREADPEVVASMGLYLDSTVQRYVNEFGQRLAAASERPRLPWTFRVIDDPTVNAFAVPGGFIYMTRGIMTHLNSEAELVGVIGHEIGHVTARHSVNQMSRAQLAQVGLGVGMIFSPELRAVGDLAGAGLQVLFLSYGRDDEHQADELGVRYMRRTGYEPGELANVMRMLERTSGAGEGSWRVPEWLSTHPNPANRVGSILEEVRRTQPVVDTGSALVCRDEYLRLIDGMVFGSNHREGYFEGASFLQPELRFRFEFPSGWKAVNQNQAVQGASPDGDAAILLTLEPGLPAQEMQRFAAGENVRVGPLRRQPVNELVAVSTEFAAATEQGVLRGLVSFVSHGDQTYRLLGLAPEGRWFARQAAVSRSLGRFAALTDPAILSVQPARLEIVQTPAEMTLAAFLEPFSIDRRAGDGCAHQPRPW